jgi:hypothetical protein
MEGISQVVHALEQSENWDDETWSVLKKKIAEKDFDYEVLKASRYSLAQFKTMSGSEHFFQRELSQFANRLFFKD